MWDEYAGLAASSAMMFFGELRKRDDLHHLASTRTSLTGMTTFVAWILICSCQGFAGEAVGAIESKSVYAQTAIREMGELQKPKYWRDINTDQLSSTVPLLTLFW